MKADQRDALRQRLRQDAAQCRHRIAQLERSAGPVAPDRALGRLTRMESLSDQGIRHAALGQQREKLYRIEVALEKVDQPGFGNCRLCGRAIPQERLLALPESDRCVACAR